MITFGAYKGTHIIKVYFKVNYTLLRKYAHLYIIVFPHPFFLFTGPALNLIRLGPSVARKWMASCVSTRLFKISFPLQVQLSRPQTNNVTHLVSARLRRGSTRTFTATCSSSTLARTSSFGVRRSFCGTSAFKFARDVIFLKNKPWR